MSDSTRVDVDAVLHVGHRVHDQHLEFASATAQSLLPLSGGPLGASGMEEAVALAHAHGDAMDRYRQFLDDARYGLEALGYVAATVADHYRIGDHAQAEEMTAIDAAFAPPPGVASLAGERAALEAEAARVAAMTAAENAELSRFLVQTGRTPTATDPEVARCSNQVDAGPGSRPASNRYSQYADAVDEHDELIGGDASQPDSAENDYDPAGEHAAAVEDAEHLSDEDNTPYVAVIDDQGHSEVVRTAPDEAILSDTDLETMEAELAELEESNGSDDDEFSRTTTD